MDSQRKREKERRPQPPFGLSVASLCHPWFITTNLSYRFPILEPSPPPCAVLLVIHRDFARMKVYWAFKIDCHKGACIAGFKLVCSDHATWKTFRLSKLCSDIWSVERTEVLFAIYSHGSLSFVKLCINRYILDHVPSSYLESFNLLHSASGLSALWQYSGRCFGSMRNSLSTSSSRSGTGCMLWNRP